MRISTILLNKTRLCFLLLILLCLFLNPVFGQNKQATEVSNKTEYPVSYYDKAKAKFGYKNKEGKIVIKPQYHSAREFNEGLARVQKGGGVRFIDKKGKTVLNLIRYEKVGEFINGYVEVNFYRSELKRNLQTRYIDRNGKIYKENPRLKEKEKLIASGYLLVKNKERSFYSYFADKTTKKRVSVDFSHISPPKEGIQLFRSDVKVGFMDADSKQEISPIRYEDANSFYDGMAAVQQDGLWGYIDTKGNMRIQPQFHYIHTEWEDEKVLVQEGDHLFYINKSGQKTSGPHFSFDNKSLEEAYELYNENGLWGLKYNNQIVTPANYDRIKLLKQRGDNMTLEVSKNGKMGLLYIYRKKVPRISIPVTYDKITEFNTDYYIFQGEKGSEKYYASLYGVHIPDPYEYIVNNLKRKIYKAHFLIKNQASVETEIDFAKKTDSSGRVLAKLLIDIWSDPQYKYMEMSDRFIKNQNTYFNLAEKNATEYQLNELNYWKDVYAKKLKDLEQKEFVRIKSAEYAGLQEQKRKQQMEKERQAQAMQKQYNPIKISNYSNHNIPKPKYDWSQDRHRTRAQQIEAFNRWKLSNPNR